MPGLAPGMMLLGDADTLLRPHIARLDNGDPGRIHEHRKFYFRDLKTA
jgi:hypothetical protein